MDPDRRRRHLLADAAGTDPRRALIAWRQLAEVEMPALELHAVQTARARGWSWSRIGRLLGRSRQATVKRFGPVDVEPPEEPDPKPSLAYRALRREADLAAERRVLEEDRRERARSGRQSTFIRRAAGRAA